jgi:hypothetical protein
MTDKQLIIMLNMIADMVQNQLLPDVLDTIYTGRDVCLPHGRAGK